jgi:hypothetical protein
MCVEDDTFQALEAMNLPDVVLLHFRYLEDAAIQATQSNRSYLEFCWTLKAITLDFVIQHYGNAEYFAHLDADLCFFSDPKALFNEAPRASLYLTDHKYSKRFVHNYATSGKFNTGFVGCRNTAIARKAIRWWRDRCLESCSSSSYPQSGIFGDQRYVEKWPHLFQNVHVIKNKGSNTSVWNIEGYKLSERNHTVFVDNDPLIFYHFSAFTILGEKDFCLTWHYPLSNEVLNLIYLPYMILLSDKIKKVLNGYPYLNPNFLHFDQVPNIHLYKL